MWRKSEPKPKGECPICDDGWPVYECDETHERSHSLPEPAGDWVCPLVDTQRREG